MSSPIFKKSLSENLYAEDGVATIWSIFWMIVFAAVGGLALDVSNGHRIRSQLQGAADSAALAAAMEFAVSSDVARARSAGMDMVAVNMQSRYNPVQPEDIQLGIWDGEEFHAENPADASDDGDINAAQVLAARTAANNNQFRTYLLRFAGFDSLSAAARSVAMISQQEAIGNDCTGLEVRSMGRIQLGGGNEVSGESCFYGEFGAANGGNDLLHNGVSIGSVDIGNINLYSLREGSDPEEEIKAEIDLDLAVFPHISNAYNTLTGRMRGSDIFERWANEEIQVPQERLPDFVFDAAGQARIVEMNSLTFEADGTISGSNSNWRYLNHAPYQPHTVFIVNGGVGVASGVHLRNVAILANGQFQGYGGNQSFDEIYVNARGMINMGGGSISYGNQAQYCDNGAYSVYMLTTNTLMYGGNGGSVTMHGMIGAGWQFSPGGAMATAGGLYFESADPNYTVQTAGDMDISNCDTPMDSEFDTVRESTSSSGGTMLVN
ncbi:pilus assembly protein TadG-related protein [Algicella marina]|nr:pilus assembly protein TadG-related protein [Algicella marina]